MSTSSKFSRIRKISFRKRQNCCHLLQKKIAQYIKVSPSSLKYCSCSHSSPLHLSPPEDVLELCRPPQPGPQAQSRPPAYCPGHHRDKVRQIRVFLFFLSFLFYFSYVHIESTWPIGIFGNYQVIFNRPGVAGVVL